MSTFYFSTHKIIVSLAVEAQLSEQSHFKSWLYLESQLCDLELFIQVSLDVVFLFSFFFLFVFTCNIGMLVSILRGCPEDDQDCT